MTENKIKTKALTFEQVKEIVDDFLTFKVSEMPENTRVVLKFITPFKEKVIAEPTEQDPKGLSVFLATAEYHNRNLKKPVVLTVQAGESCIRRLEIKSKEKFGETESYVGLFAYVSKTKFGTKNPQFINPFKGELLEKETKDEAFAPKTSVSVNSDDDEEISPEELEELQKQYEEVMM